MEAKLNREDLVALLKGVVPNWGAMDNPLVKKAGWYFCDYGNSHWKSLDNLTDEELYECYLICKKSWNK